MTEQDIQNNARLLKSRGVPNDRIRDYITTAFAELEGTSKEAAAAATPAEAAAVMPVMRSMSGSQMYPVSSPQEAARGLATIAETLPGMVGQTVAGPAGGFVGGGAGDILGQAIRMGAGLQQGYSSGRTTAAAMYSALPFSAAGAAPTAFRSAAAIGGDVLKYGTAGGAIENIKQFMDTGRMATPGEMAVAGGIAGGFGGAGRALSEFGQSIAQAGMEAVENAAKYLRAGVRNPTPGQLNPAKYGGMEARIVEREPTGPVAQAVQQSYNELSESIHNISGSGRYEPANFFEAIATKAKAPRTLEPELLNLNQRAQDAQLRLQDAKARLQEAGLAYNARAVQEGNKLADVALTESLNSAAENARRIMSERITGGIRGLTPAQARDRLVNDVLAPMNAAYKTHWDNMYSFFPEHEPVFTTAPVQAAVEATFKTTGASIPAPIKSLLENEQISLFGLREVRNGINALGKIGEADVTGVERYYRDLGATISEEMSKQAPTAFGRELGDQFRLVNADYSNYSKLWDKPGLEILQATNIKDVAVSRMVDALKRTGIEADAFKNVVNLIANMATPQTAKRMYLGEAGTVIESANAKVNPELASEIKGHFLDLIRGNLIDEVSVGNKVVPEKLVSTLREIGRDNKSLQALGLGSPAQIDELAMLLKKHDSASTLTVDQWRDLFSSPSFKESFRTGSTIASLIEPVLKVSDIDNLISKAVLMEKSGNTAYANRLFENARKNAESSAAELSAVERKIQTARQDPTYDIFNRPMGQQVPVESYTKLKDVLFNPSSSSPVNNQFVSDLAGALRNSKNPGDRELLRQLQNEYLTTYLVEFDKAAPVFEKIKGEKLSALLSPNSRKAAKGEQERAKALLDPDQYQALNDVADAAVGIMKYEASGRAGVPKPEGFNVIQRGWNAVADLIRRRSYEKAVDAIINPSVYANRLLVNGEWLTTAGESAKRAIAPMMQLRENVRAQPVQTPSYLRQFIPQPATQGVPNLTPFR